MKTRLFLFLAALAMSFGTVSALDTWTGNVSSSLDGSGTPGDPYLIKTCADFRYFAISGSESAYYRLEDDLDFSNIQMAGYSKTFTGFFDGNNKKFYNINIDGAGIFPSAGGGAVILNLGVENGTMANGPWRAGLVGDADKQSLYISNCYNKATVGGHNGEYGGIVGFGGPNVSIVNCFASCSITNNTDRTSNNGALVGNAGNGTQLICSYAYGAAVTSVGNKLGGNNPVINNSYYEGNSNNGDARTTAYMKSDDFVTLLNNNRLYTVWLKDESNVNNGYPVLNEAYRAAFDVVGGIVVPEEGYDPYLMYKGGEYKFRLEKTDPQASANNIQIKVNGQVITPVNEVYTVLVGNTAPLIETSGYFARSSYNVTLNPGANGTITGNASPAFNTVQTYSITPSAGYTVHTVFVNDRPQSPTTTLQLTITDDYVVTATFVPSSEVSKKNSDVSASLSGSGTPASPYLIQSCADWEYLCGNASLRTGGYEFMLTKHLDFDNQSTSTISEFVGFFNGNNKTFMNVNVNATGLFQTIKGNAARRFTSVICNLGIVSGKMRNGTNAVALVGAFESDDITTESVKFNYTGAVMNCYNYADMGENGVGILNKIVKYDVLPLDAMIANCYNRGEVGIGFVGEYKTRIPVLSCYNAGKTYSRHFNGSDMNDNGGYVTNNTYYDAAYANSTANSGAFMKEVSTATLKSEAMLGNLNSNFLFPMERKVWLIDSQGAINAGSPYLNEAYRVIANTTGIAVKPAFSYNPYFAYKGDTYIFRVTSADGTKRLDETATVKVGTDVVLPNTDGEYVVENVQGNLVITVDNLAFATDNTISVWNLTSQAITNGNGSEFNPYLIESAAQYAWFTKNINNNNKTYYKLTTDIDFNGYYVPMAGEFSGSLNGDYHTLYNLNIARGWSTSHLDNATDNIGVFAKLNGGEIKNLRIEGGTIYGRWTVGFIADVQDSDNLISNTYIKASMLAGEARVGAFAAKVSGSMEINNSYHHGRLYYKNTASDVTYGAFVAEGSPVAINSYAVNNMSQITNGSLGSGSENSYFFSGETAVGTYGKTAGYLQSAEYLTLLNSGGRKFWVVDANRNEGFPAFNKYYPVTFPAITDAVFEPVAGYEAIAYEGDSYKFQITPIPSMTAKNLVVSINGVEVSPDENNHFVIDNVNNDIVVTYTGELEIKKFEPTLKFNAEGGNVEASKTGVFNYGEWITYTITPAEGYVGIAYVNGEKTSYSDNKLEIEVTTELDVEIVFEKQTFEILLMISAGGTVDVADGSTNPVTYGEDVTFVMTPDAGYEIKSVKVDGEEVSWASDNTYTFTNVTTDNHTLDVTFQKSLVGLKDALLSGWTIVPVNGQLQISSDEASSFDVQLYDITGKLLSIAASEDSVVYVDVPFGGIYLLKIVCENKVFTVKVAV